MIECKTQAQLDKALAKAKPGELIACTGGGHFEVCGSSQVRAYGSSQVTACDSSQVTACGSSQVTACGSSQVRAYDSSQVTAYGSSQVRAYGSSQVTAYDSSQVKATPHVAVTKHGKTPKIKGGVLIEYTPPATAKEWCANYGVTVKRGVAILYKAVGSTSVTTGTTQTEWTTRNNVHYMPGTKPSAPDWDGGNAECGFGLHFSPTPAHALAFNSEPRHFVACPVKVSEIVVHPDGVYPEKVKAPRVCAPCFEVDIHGNPVGAEDAA